jgi:hypothetical protein
LRPGSVAPLKIMALSTAEPEQGKGLEQAPVRGLALELELVPALARGLVLVRGLVPGQVPAPGQALELELELEQVPVLALEPERERVPEPVPGPARVPEHLKSYRSYGNRRRSMIWPEHTGRRSRLSACSRCR